MRTVAIVLSDNDFGHTFKPLLENLAAVIEYREGETLDKNVIDLIIRSGIMFHYLAYQHRFDLDHCRLESDTLDHTESYLKGINVLFDEEAEKDIETKDHDGGAWYLELQSGMVYGY